MRSCVDCNGISTQNVKASEKKKMQDRFFFPHTFQYPNNPFCCRKDVEFWGKKYLIMSTPESNW